MSSKIGHPYHLVHPSPWPLLAAIRALGITGGFIVIFHSKDYTIFFLSLFRICLVLFQWWRDVCREGTYLGLHTEAVVLGLRWGIVLFIISEVIFFFSFFWAFFHSSLSPNIELGCQWPPIGIKRFRPFGVPLINTFILLTSGLTVTVSHVAIVSWRNKFWPTETDLICYSFLSGFNLSPSEIYYQIGIKSSLFWGKLYLFFTILWGLFFTSIQLIEYLESTFTIADGIYGRTFFITTGFHGFHVIVGTIFLIVCLIRLKIESFSKGHHFGFEAAVWYWHFVDVVWLFLYFRVYWWGGK